MSYHLKCFFVREPELLHLYEEVPDMLLCHFRAHLTDQVRIVCNEAAAGPLGIHKTAPLKLGQGLLHCVRIYRRIDGQIPDGREFVAGLISPGDDVVLNTFH